MDLATLTDEIIPGSGQSTEFRVFTLSVVLVILAHAVVDALCTVSTLFHVERLKFFSTLYPSLFLHSYVRDDPLINRLVIYASTSMSLVRLMAVVTPFNAPIMTLVGIMYSLEGLICMYELDTAHTANATVATRAIMSATFMTVVCFAHALLSWAFVTGC